MDRSTQFIIAQGRPSRLMALAHNPIPTGRRVMMSDELIARLADGVGEHFAAAMHDHESANPEDVGLHGVPIKAWREGYAEGCKDMGGTVLRLLALDEAGTKAFQARALASLKKHPRPRQGEREC
jgi:hypothetical protein